MENQIEKMQSWFTRQIGRCECSAAVLTADERHDEAAFEKIRGNVYDIFRTILNVAVKQHGEDEKKILVFFRQKLEQIPAPWTVSLEQAKRHDDVKKQRIEQIKLETVDMIRARFGSFGEGEV